MSANIADTFKVFQEHLNNEQEVREEIRKHVREIEKISRDVVLILQNIHNVQADENIIVAEYCAKARKLFEDIREHYAKLALIVPNDQYYRFHFEWKSVTQRLCFLASLVVYLEVKVLVTKDVVADIFGIKHNSEEGFHLDLEDFLMGLLQLSSELSRFAVNSVTNGNYEQPLEIAHFVNEMNAGFRLLNLKNDALRKRFDSLKYNVRKIEEVVYDLSIRGLTTSVSAKQD